jgi:hypothetical protein
MLETYRMPQRRKSYQDVLDTILLEMGANHPGLSSDEEGRLKQALLDIMGDEDGWQKELDAMVLKFETAMRVLQRLRDRRVH